MLDIETPAADRSLLTIEELRAAAGVADDSRDAELQVLGDAIADLIVTACQVARVRDIPPTLRAEALIETFNAPAYGYWAGGHGPGMAYDRGAPLRPARRPIASISTVTEGGTLLDASDYELDGAAIYRKTGIYRSHWRCGPVVIHYTAGWDVVPPGLKWAARKFVQIALFGDGRDPMLKRKVTVGISEYEWWVDPTRDSLVPPEVMDILIRGAYANRWAWLR